MCQPMYDAISFLCGIYNKMSPVTIKPSMVVYLAMLNENKGIEKDFCKFILALVVRKKILLRGVQNKQEQLGFTVFACKLCTVVIMIVISILFQLVY